MSIRGVKAKGIAATLVVSAAATTAAVIPAFASGGAPVPSTQQHSTHHKHAWASPPKQLSTRLSEFVPHERGHQKPEPKPHHHRHHTAAQPATRTTTQPASRTTYRQPLSTDPRTAAHALVLRRGWSETEWSCLDQLWTRESGWNTFAQNPSGAYGIPQALPGSKMASFGSDWQTNPVTQIQWGLWYIAASYGTPCGALSHENSYGYY